MQLQGLGKESAVAALTALASADQNDTGVIVLCRMLFTSRPNREYQSPYLGMGAYFGGTTYSDWPLTPIEIVDGVPFCIVHGYTVVGREVPVSAYLEYCVRECAWGIQMYSPKTMAAKQAALDKLLESGKWKDSLTADDRAYLAAQIQ